MAQALGHKWGQIIGEQIEAAMLESLRKTAKKNKLFLDHQGERKARSGRKVTWTDCHGNQHDLDYVLERGGSESNRGDPVAFIEVAWRRYTKHSRNKVQEIQGAIVPLAETYSHLRPFLGVILAGVFTEGAIKQLESLGFDFVYFSYESIVNAFSTVGIDASYTERTPESNFRKKLRAWDKLSTREISKFQSQLLKNEKTKVNQFLEALNLSLRRQIQHITITTFHGHEHEVRSVSQAVSYLESYTIKTPKDLTIVKYELRVHYNNGDCIHAMFQEKAEALSFLNTLSQNSVA